MLLLFCFVLRGLLLLVYFSNAVLNFSFVILISEPLESCLSPLTSFLSDKSQHRPSLPRRSPSPIPLVRPRAPRCNHGGDEDEVPLWEKGEASPGTVAPLLVSHYRRGCHLQPGMHPQGGAPQEGRGTVLSLTCYNLETEYTSKALLFLIFSFFLTFKLPAK